MYTVTYKDLHHRCWQDDHVFGSFEKVKEYLGGKGFTMTSGVFTRGQHGWCLGLKAYVMKMKEY